MLDSLRLFLVEDDDDIALLVGKTLERAGHKVTRCRTDASSRIRRSMYSSFRCAGQPAYRVAHSDSGSSQTAKVSAKSSSGWLCAYQ